MAAKQKSLKLNFIMNSILTMSTFIFPLITFPYISRILLPEGTGKVSFGTSLLFYFVMFSQLGLPTFGVRTCARIRDDRRELSKTAHELLFINLILAVVAYIVLAVLVLTIPKLYNEKLMYVILSSNIFLTAIGMEWLYKALEQYSYITIRSIAFKFIALIAMFLLIHKKEDYVIYAGISIFASSASSILNFINAHKYIDFKWLGNYNLMRHMKPIIIFFAMAVAATIYTHVDTVMLGFMKTDTDVGYYNAAVKIKTILVSIVTSLGAVLLPRASYYVEHNMMDEFKRITEKALKFVFLIACPMTLYFTLFAKEGIFFLSGNEYSGAILPMQVIMPTLILIGITNILGIQILIPLGKEKTVFISEAAGAVTDVILNAILIPFLASTGAAIGTLAAEIVVLIVQYLALKDSISDAFKQVKYLKIIAALVLSSAASIWVWFFDFSPFISILISGSLFFGVYIIFMIIAREEIITDTLKQVINKFKGIFQKFKKVKN